MGRPRPFHPPAADPRAGPGRRQAGEAGAFNREVAGSGAGARRPGRAHRLLAAILPLLVTLVLACLLVLIWADPGRAQGAPLDLPLPEGGALAERSVQLLVLVTLLGLVPGLAVMITCFPFMVTVLAILRQALGLQQSPPNMLLVSLALFLTWFVMDPVLTAAWQQGIRPWTEGAIEIDEAFLRAIEPFRGFMANRIDPGSFEALAGLRPGLDPAQPIPEAPLSVLVPSFMLSEIARAFQVGFMIFLPFLIIDLVVAAVLMSMGMMMVPPAIVSLPFKLAFFVVADGWSLLAGSLVRSYL